MAEEVWAAVARWSIEGKSEQASGIVGLDSTMKSSVGKAGPLYRPGPCRAGGLGCRVSDERQFFGQSMSFSLSRKTFDPWSS
jgi:hypothetical protein